MAILRTIYGGSDKALVASLERKHRVLKDIILYVFRSVGLTSTKDFVNNVAQQYIEGRFRFEEYWLENSIDIVLDGQAYDVSWHVHTPIGEVHRDDLLLAVEDGIVIVGCANRFFEQDGQYTVDITCFQSAGPRDWTDWVTDSPRKAIIDLPSVIANLKWARRNERIIRIVLPSTLKLP